MSVRQVCERHDIDLTVALPTAWTGVLLKNHWRWWQNVQKKMMISAATLQSLRKSDQMEWHFLLLQDQERDQGAGLAMAPTVTNAVHQLCG